MLSRDIFEHRTQACQDSVLPPDITARIVVEQASTFGWGALRRQVRPNHQDGDIRRVGALKELQRKFGFGPDRVTEVAKELLGKSERA